MEIPDHSLPSIKHIKIDTSTGKHQLHGTTMAAFPKNFPSKTKTVMYIQRRSKGHRSKAPLYEDTNLSEPVKKSFTATVNYFAEISEVTLQDCCTYDLVWFLLKALCMVSKVCDDVWQNL